MQAGWSCPSSSGGWAKGTGYGGPGVLYGLAGPQGGETEQKCREAAALRQQVVDSHLQRAITDICNCLERTTGACYTVLSHAAAAAAAGRAAANGAATAAAASAAAVAAAAFGLCIIQLSAQRS